MCLEVTDQNTSRSSALAAEREAIFHWWFLHFILSKNNSFQKSVWLSRSFSKTSSVGTKRPNLPACPLLPKGSLSVISSPPPTCFLPHSSFPTRLLTVYLQSRRGSCPHRWIQWVKGDTVSIGTWKEPGSLCCPTHVFWCGQTGWWRSFAPVMTLRNRQGRNCQLWSRPWDVKCAQREPLWAVVNHFLLTRSWDPASGSKLNTPSSWPGWL